MTNWKSFLMGISQRAELDAKPMESNPTPCGEILGRVEGRVNKPGQLSAISESDQSGVEVRAYLALLLIGWGRCRDRAHFRTRVPRGISACKRRRYGQAVG